MFKEIIGKFLALFQQEKTATNNNFNDKKKFKTNNINSNKTEKITTKRLFDLNRLDKNAVAICNKLNRAGFEAYIVGGAVRDLLLNKNPKDFDVATNATPNQIHHLLRNSRIIGKRFKLIHAYFGKEVIEVATFRKDDKEVNIDENGKILRDNNYGTLKDDVYRRDFSINALYYDLQKDKIIDEVNGLRDISNKTIALLGNVNERYVEDPVRILRALRFAAKLNFHLEERTSFCIYEYKHLLKNVSNARLYEEMLKMFLFGDALQSWYLMQEFGLIEIMFPDSYLYKNNENYEKFIQEALKNTDDRINKGLSVNPAFLFSAILFPIVLEKQMQLVAKHDLHPNPAFAKAISLTLSSQNKMTAFTKIFSINIQNILLLQDKLTRVNHKNAEHLLHQDKFRAAFDFLMLRSKFENEIKQVANWWEQYLDNESKDKSKLLNLVKERKSKKRKDKAVVYSYELYLGLGSNLNNPLQQVQEAIEALKEIPESKFISQSSFYQNKPLDNREQPDYVNAVVKMKTNMRPMTFLRKIQQIETLQGRVREEDKFAARVIDIDILLINDLIIKEKDLIVPHYDLTRRDFVLYPLYEIAGNIQIAKLGSLEELMQKIPNTLEKINK